MSETIKENELTVKYEIDGNEIKLTQKSVQEYIVGTKDQITIGRKIKWFLLLCLR